MSDFSTWRVLAIDDEPDNLNLLGDLLEFKGSVVTRAVNADQGFREIEKEKPTVILLDLSMPGMDGWEMHRRLRQRPELADVPIIAITALAMHSDVERARGEGFDGFITKPFRIQSLLSEVQTFVNQFENQRGATTAQSAPASQGDNVSQKPSA